MLPHSNHTHYEELDISSFLNFPPPASLHEHSSVAISPPGRLRVRQPPPTSAAVEKRATGESPELIPCRRKYRRSKICTAQGLRDRRMRLSLDVAGKFFDLQDLLGFDKASKTVQWLLSKSKYAIKELAIPAMREAPAHYQFEQQEEEDVAGVFTAKAEQRNSIVVKSLRTRESRKKARERARQRTLEKKRMKINEYCGGGGQDHEETDRDNNASAALLFDYDYQTAVDCLFQEPWETDFRVNFDEGVLLDW